MSAGMSVVGRLEFEFSSSQNSDETRHVTNHCRVSAPFSEEENDTSSRPTDAWNLLRLSMSR